MTVLHPAKAVIACVHLGPTPGSAGYAGRVEEIYQRAGHRAGAERLTCPTPAYRKASGS